MVSSGVGREPTRCRAICTSRGREPQPPKPHLRQVHAAGAAAPAEGKLVVETQPESPSVPPPEPPSASQKDLKGYVVLAIGLPGSGKTTWFKRRGVTPLSSDMLRSILFDDITEQRYQGLVFSTLRSLLRARLIAKMPWNYVDATNLSAHERRQWIKMAKSFGYEAQAVFFDVPLEVCMERNSRRERTVSDEIMRKMAERLRPPSFKEGFSKITMVRVKGRPAAQNGRGRRGAAQLLTLEPAAHDPAIAFDQVGLHHARRTRHPRPRRPCRLRAAPPPRCWGAAARERPRCCAWSTA